ncbi:MAG: BTAD domain-containing putative transcriptional regulator, partial [Acidimicrobiia bacterium]
MEAMRIHLFGGFLLERGGVAYPPIASRAGRSLFAYLVMNRDRPIQRDLLAGSFWPDLPEGRARRRLSHTLWQIQDVISDGAMSHLAVTTDTLAFDTSLPFWLDVEEFDRGFALSEMQRRDATPGATRDAAALRACVELYRGDFMAGFFDDWVVVDQDHYRQRYLVALSRLVDVTKANGAYEEALGYARRLTHHDSLSEEFHQEVMRLCFLLGRTGEAVQQFERCRSVLAEELGSEPSPATVDLYKKVVRQRQAGIRPVRDQASASLLGSRADAPFVGREEERRSLIDHMERVLAGPGGVVLVEGEPGVGKTRLAVEAAEDAQWRGFEISSGACAPGALRPFAPLVEVLGSLSPLRVEQLSEQVTPVWLGEALRLAPQLRHRTSSEPASLRPAEESTRMKDALVHTLGALGKITPHLVIVDDVQWADKDTLGVLTQLGPRLAESRILLMLIYRSEEARGDPEVWDVLRELDQVAGLGRVVLSPLSVFELDEMVKRILGLGRLDPSVAAQLHRQTGGNALFSVETLLALRDRGVFEQGDPAEMLQRQLAGPTVPLAPRVRSVIDSRMSLLRDEVAAVFELAAVCGNAVDLDLLARGTDLSRSIVLDSVDELLHRSLLRDEGDGRYRITHDQVRQVVYERIEDQRRVGLHRRVAETLSDLDPDDVEAIGYHYWEGEVSDRAASYLLKAGLRAAGLNAYATARQHLQTAGVAAALAGWADEERYHLLGHLEGVLNVLGLRDEQRDVISEMAMLAEGTAELAGDLGIRRAWLLAHTADFGGAEESARESVEIERSRGDGAALSAALVAFGTSLRWSGRPLDAVPHLEAAVEAAVGSDQATADALTELASTLVEVQRSVEALPHLERAGSIYQGLDDLRGQAEVAGIQARAYHQQGNRDRAQDRFENAIALCQEIGYRHGEGVNLVNLSLLHHLLGRVVDALSGYDRAGRIFSELGNVRGEAMVLANSAWARHSSLGDDERAEADARRSMKVFVEMGDRAHEAQCLEIVAGVLARRGRTAEARVLLEDSLRALDGTGNRFLETQHLRSLALLQLKQAEH